MDFNNFVNSASLFHLRLRDLLKDSLLYFYIKPLCGLRLIASNKVLHRGLEFKSVGFADPLRRRGALKFNLRGLKRILHLFPLFLFFFFVLRKVIKAGFTVSLLVAVAAKTREEWTYVAATATRRERGAAKAEIRFTHRFLRSRAS